MTVEREGWSGRVGFVLATIGSAVGLGSIWKFPYEVGANGGGTFVLFYLAGLALIVVPLMFAEFAIGRRGRGDPATSMAVIARETHASRWWQAAGVLGVVTGFLILSFYSVIGGWTLGYLYDTLRLGLPGTSPAAVQTRFDDFLASPAGLALWHALFMAVTAIIVARGIAGGIETASKALMPLLVGLMILLAGYGMIEGDLPSTLRFLFRPDPAGLTAEAALEALGLGFFSIGVGLGLMITYAAYSGENIDLRQTAIVSVAADTAISFLAGLAVFPVVFAHGLDPAGGPGLVFVTLPLAFAQMPFGTVAAEAFFLLLFVAALLSSVSMLELVVAMTMRRWAMARPRAALLASSTCFAAGLLTVFSFNLLADWHPLGAFAGFEQATAFDLLDYLTSNLLLPACGLAIALFAAWIAPDRLLATELRLGPAGARVLAFVLRVVVPAGIVATAAMALMPG